MKNLIVYVKMVIIIMKLISVKHANIHVLIVLMIAPV